MNEYYDGVIEKNLKLEVEKAIEKKQEQLNDIKDSVNT